ncbi:YWTD domain-containing protein [Trichodelitschia bisporula]|uniref:YWTD domain-containing protein n=1 Tax=Trichodelitschia bisporula TaxID=703511 RepID=A0A6G1I9F5_9PEZI|nr:YWTD domain-containing protein [Trichodelitschia bisporula]
MHFLRTASLAALLLLARAAPLSERQWPDLSDSDDAETVVAAPLNATSAGGRLYFLDQGGFKAGRILSTKADGTDLRVILEGLRAAPDGIAVDRAAGYIYFTNMGTSAGNTAAGSVQRVGLDGKGLVTVVQPGKTHTAKQLTLVEEGGKKKLYWGDREGMKVMRANIDGSGLEVVVDTAKYACSGEPCKHVVGVAVDTKNGFVYWTQKGGEAGGQGSIHRAPTTLKAGETAGARSDVQTLLKGLPEPIDAHWVAESGTLYWTDRGRTTGGNSVNKLVLGAAAAGGAVQGAKAQVLYGGLGTGIGIAVDVPSNQVWATDLRGQVWLSDLEGKNKKKIASGLGILVGITYVE